MTTEEFEEKRIRQWRLRPEFALTTERELYQFIREVGASSLSTRKNSLYPSLVQAINGSTDHHDQRWDRDTANSELVEKFLGRYLDTKRVFEVILLQNCRGVVSREWMSALVALLASRKTGRGLRRSPFMRTHSAFDLAVEDVIR